MRRAVTTMCSFIGGSAAGYVLVGLLAAAFGVAVAALIDRTARGRRNDAGAGSAQDMPAIADTAEDNRPDGDDNA